MVVARRPEAEGVDSRLGGLGAQAASVAERLRESVVSVAGRLSGAGAGTIWSPDGLIVTNNHVAPGSRAEVTLRDGRSFRAEVIASDPTNDLAALEIQANGLPAVQPRDSDFVRVGEVVIAVGHPWGQRGAVSSGIVFSRNGAMVEGLTLARAIRADVALAPGNSGGPLADIEGRVIGINAMIIGGMAAAVPTNTVKEFLAAGAGEPGLLGITGEPIAAPDGVGSADRAALIITSVAEGSPAEAAGLIPGDILLAVGEGLPSLSSVTAGLKRMRAGVTVTLAVVRAGALRHVKATPTAQPQS